MAYGTPLPNLDQALAQWNAAQGTPPPGAVPQYQLDPGLMGPPVNPWADALAMNGPREGETPAPAIAPSASDTTSSEPSEGGADFMYLDPAKAVLDAGKRYVKGFAQGMAKGYQEEEAAHPKRLLNPAFGMAQGIIQGTKEAALGTYNKPETEADRRRQSAATREAEERIKAGQQNERPEFSKPSDEIIDFGAGAGGTAAIASLGIDPLQLDPRFQLAHDLSDAANDRFANAGQKIAEIEGERAHKQLEATDTFGKGIADVHGRYEKQRELVEGSQDAALKDWQQGQEELGKMKIDPNKLFHDGGVPLALLTVLGSAIGGTLGAMDGSNTNQFMNQVNKMIDRDVAAQSAAIGNKRADQAAKMNLVGYWRSRLGDTYAAEQAAKASIYDQLKVQTDKLASQSQWDQAPLVAEQIGAQADMRKAASLQGLASIAQNVAGANFGAQATLVSNKASAFGKAAEEANKVRPSVEDVRKNNDATIETLDDGVRIFVPDQMRAPLSGQISATRAFESQALKTIAKWDRLTAAGRAAELARLGNSARVAEHSGAYDNGIKDLNQDRYGKPRTDIGQAISEYFGGLSSKEAIADEVAHMREMTSQAIRNAGSSYAQRAQTVVKGGRLMDYYIPVRGRELNYAGAPRTAIAPTVDNVPKKR